MNKLIYKMVWKDGLKDQVNSLKLLPLCCNKWMAYKYLFSDEHQEPSSVSVLALVFGMADKYPPSPSSYQYYFSSLDTIATELFFKTAVPPSTK